MNTRRSFLEGAGGALLLSFVPWSPAYGAQVVDVRAWPAEEYTRITIEHDAPMKFKYFVLRNSDPVRLAVDIDGLLLTDKLKQIIQKVKPNDPYISRIRVGQNRPNVVRISIDFKTDVDPQVFSLKPAGQYRYRLVFDIYPATQKDPLMAIIQKEESEPDAIKSLLAQVAEGQKRMEENRADSGEEVDQLGQILAGIADGTLAPMRPDEEPKGTSKPSQTKPAKKPETQLAQTKPSKTKPTSLSEGQNLGHHDRSGARRRRPGRYRKKTSDKRKRRRAGNCTNFAPGT
ncbi:MAG: AMIN domain-containing protein [Parasutterella sp.]